MICSAPQILIRAARWILAKFSLFPSFAPYLYRSVLLNRGYFCCSCTGQPILILLFSLFWVSTRTSCLGWALGTYDYQQTEDAFPSLDVPLLTFRCARALLHSATIVLSQRSLKTRYFKIDSTQDLLRALMIASGNTLLKALSISRKIPTANLLFLILLDFIEYYRLSANQLVSLTSSIRKKWEETQGDGVLCVDAPERWRFITVFYVSAEGFPRRPLDLFFSHL